MTAFICLSLTVSAQESTRPDNAKVNWVTIEEAIQILEKGGNTKIFMVDAYTDWCGWCKRMDKSTFRHPEVIEVLNEHFVAVKFNAESTRDIKFGDQTLKFVASGRKGYHELAAALMQGKLSYPTLVFLNENFEMIQPIPGYRNGKQLLPIIKFLGEGHYLSMSYNKFMEEYEKDSDEE